MYRELEAIDERGAGEKGREGLTWIQMFGEGILVRGLDEGKGWGIFGVERGGDGVESGLDGWLGGW